jgi:hypothetical protein
MVLRVRPRPTYDIDLVVVADRAELDDLLELARSLGYGHDTDAQTRQLAEEGLVQLYGPAGRADSYGVDVIFADSSFLREVAERSMPVMVGALSLPVAVVEDLLLLKLDAGRPIDIDDAIAIKDAFGETLDRAYLARRGAELDLMRPLENLLGSL